MHLNNIVVHPEKYPNQEYYPFSLSIFHEAREIVFDSPVTLFVGENGTGKSTLLEAIATGAGIHIWRNSERRRPEYNP